MSDFPFKLGVSGSKFPLSGNPYWSRITYSQLQNSPAKNYFVLAFKPGLPLQASELNEIQEIYIMNETLTTTMNSSWPVFQSSFLGGSPIYGPGWHGTTPLYPQFDNVNTTKNMVGLTGASGDSVLVDTGWYLMTLKSSGLKHWMYLNKQYTVKGSSANPIPDQPFYLGFTATYETIKPTSDPSLYDNSSGTSIPVSGAPAGADRIVVKISEPFWTNDITTENFSPMIKKIDTGTPNLYIHLYMNNVPVPGA